MTIGSRVFGVLNVDGDSSAQVNYAESHAYPPCVIHISWLQCTLREAQTGGCTIERANAYLGTQDLWATLCGSLSVPREHKAGNAKAFYLPRLSKAHHVPGLCSVCPKTDWAAEGLGAASLVSGGSLRGLWGLGTKRALVNLVGKERDVGPSQMGLRHGLNGSMKGLQGIKNWFASASQEIRRDSCRTVPHKLAARV